MNEAGLREQVQTLARYCEEHNRPLRPPPAVPIYEDSTKLRCGCGKYRPVKEMPIRSTGVVKFVDNMCPDCAEQDKGMARIVCAGCRTVVARMAPHVDQYGFKCTAGHYYHVDKCPGCAPGQEESMILEKVIFMRKKFGPQWKP